MGIKKSLYQGRKYEVHYRLSQRLQLNFMLFRRVAAVFRLLVLIQAGAVFEAYE